MISSTRGTFTVDVTGRMIGIKHHIVAKLPEKGNQPAFLFITKITLRINLLSGFCLQEFLSYKVRALRMVPVPHTSPQDNF